MHIYARVVRGIVTKFVLLEVHRASQLPRRIVGATAVWCGGCASGAGAGAQLYLRELLLRSSRAGVLRSRCVLAIVPDVKLNINLHDTAPFCSDAGG